MSKTSKKVTISETHPTWIEFDADALRHNLRIVRKSVRPATQIIASVKANAYGHGIVPVSQVLEDEGVEMLATGSVSYTHLTLPTKA